MPDDFCIEKFKNKRENIPLLLFIVINIDQAGPECTIFLLRLQVNGYHVLLKYISLLMI